MLKALRWAAFTILGLMSLLGLYVTASPKLGKSVEAMTDSRGTVLEMHVYDFPLSTKIIGVIGIVGCILVIAGAVAAVRGNFPIARIVLLAAVLASLTAGPVFVFVTIFAGLALMTARDRQISA